MKEIIVVPKGSIEAAYEYKCRDCGQLRLNLDKDREKVCGNCGSANIVCGPPGSLEKP